MKPPARLIAPCCLSCLGLLGCGPNALRTTLHQAVKRGDLNAVQQLIAAKTELDKTNLADWTPLRLAAMEGDLAIQ